MDNNEMSQKLAEHDVLIRETAEDIKALEHKVDDLHRIATSVELIAQDMTHIKSDISEVKSNQDSMKRDIAEVKNADNQRKALMVDNIKDKLLWLFIGGIAAGLLATVLPQFFKQ